MWADPPEELPPIKAESTSRQFGRPSWSDLELPPVQRYLHFSAEVDKLLPTGQIWPTACFCEILLFMAAFVL